MSATPDIVMYSTGWCPYCVRARTLLERFDVPGMSMRSALTPGGGFSLDRWVTPSLSTQR